MKNLIKAQLYQISKTRMYLWVFLFFSAMSALLGASEYMNGEDYLEDGMLLTASDFATRMGMVPTLTIMAIAFFTAFVCADDFSDKTCNYEMMSGRMRGQTYIARAAVSVTMSVLIGVFMVALSLGVCTLLEGWGDTIPVSAAVTRILLLVFPFFRFSCFFVLLSYILKKPIFVVVAAYGLFSLLAIIVEAGGSNLMSVLTAYGNMGMLLQYDFWYTFGMDSSAHFVYEPALGAVKIISTIVASLAFGAAYLGVAYCYFHGDDLE